MTRRTEPQKTLPRATNWQPREDEALLRAKASGAPNATIADHLTRVLGRRITADAIQKRLKRLHAARPGDPPRPPEASDVAEESVDVDLSELDLPRSLPPLDFEDEPETEPDLSDERRSASTAIDDTRSEDPVARRDQRDEVTRLRHTIDELVRRLQEANARQAFIEAAGQFHEPPRILPREKLSGVREMTFVALASDWHVEEPVYPESIAYRNEYNLEIAARRIERFFRSIVWEVEHNRASGRIAIRDMLLWLGGDLYSGYIHEELVESNLLSPTEAVQWLLPRLRDGIATLLEHLSLERIVIPCSFGNHGRTTHKPRIATGYANSFDWLLYHWLASEFRNDPRVTFEITASAHQYVQVYDRTIHFHHGDDVKYMGGVGGLGIPLLKAVPMWDRVKQADVHCIGHWHMLRDYDRAVVNGSLIGFGPYSQRIRAEFEEPRQGWFLVDSKRGRGGLERLWVGEREADDRAA